MEERRRPCDPGLCPDHSAHEQALAAGNERFKGIDSKLDILLTWKAEMKGMWLLTVAAAGVFSSFAGMLIGGATVYYTAKQVAPAVQVSQK